MMILSTMRSCGIIKEKDLGLVFVILLSFVAKLITFVAMEATPGWSKILPRHPIISLSNKKKEKLTSFKHRSQESHF